MVGLETRRYGGLEDTMGEGEGKLRQWGSRGAGRGSTIAAPASTVAHCCYRDWHGLS